MSVSRTVKGYLCCLCITLTAGVSDVIKGIPNALSSVKGDKTERVVDNTEILSTSLITSILGMEGGREEMSWMYLPALRSEACFCFVLSLARKPACNYVCVPVTTCAVVWMTVCVYAGFLPYVNGFLHSQ